MRASALHVVRPDLAPVVVTALALAALRKAGVTEAHIKAGALEATVDLVRTRVIEVDAAAAAVARALQAGDQLPAEPGPTTAVPVVFLQPVIEGRRALPSTEADRLAEYAEKELGIHLLPWQRQALAGVLAAEKPTLARRR